MSAWINCKDKLPPHKKFVLVFGENRMSIACLRVDGAWYVKGWDETDHIVTHWRFVRPPDEDKAQSKNPEYMEGR